MKDDNKMIVTPLKKKDSHPIYNVLFALNIAFLVICLLAVVWCLLFLKETAAILTLVPICGIAYIWLPSFLILAIVGTCFHIGDKKKK